MLLWGRRPHQISSSFAGIQEMHPFFFCISKTHLVPPTENQQKTHKTPMELNIEGFDGRTYVVDVDVDDTAKDLRRKVAATVGFAEHSFLMSFGNGEGEDINITALSAGDTVVLTQMDKEKAVAALRALGMRDLTPERLALVEDPNVARLFLQAELVTAIPSRFLEKNNLRRRHGTFVEFCGISKTRLLLFPLIKKFHKIPQNSTKFHKSAVPLSRKKNFFFRHHKNFPTEFFFFFLGNSQLCPTLFLKWSEIPENKFRYWSEMPHFQK